MFHMIHCDLAALLTKRHLKISKVFQDTKISRTTLTALAYGHAKGIQFDTLNTLCTYLKVNASDLFQHIPIDITWVREVWFDDGESWQDQVILTITKNGKSKDYPLWLNVTRPDEKGFCNADLTFELPYTLKNTNPPLPVISEEDAAECRDVIETLPLDFYYDLADQIKDDCYPDVEVTNLSVFFHWPFSEERCH